MTNAVSMRRLGPAIELLLRRGGIRGGCWDLALGLPACGLLLLLALLCFVFRCLGAIALGALLVIVHLERHDFLLLYTRMIQARPIMRSAEQHQFLVSTSDRRARVSGGSVRSCSDSAAAKLAFAHHTLVVVTEILHPVLIVRCLAG